MHVLSTDKCTYLRVHKKRGSEAFDEVIEKFEGKLIHDFFKSYFNLPNSKHYPCGSHITRELDFLIDNKSEWAIKFKELYYELYHRDYQYNESIREDIYKKYRQILTQAIKEEPTPIRTRQRGRLKKSKGLNLALRLETHMEEILAFAFDPVIPFTNNQAERDLRHSKIKLKVSGCFRSVAGAEYYSELCL